ncbi:transposase, partial [Escherichia coli]
YCQYTSQALQPGAVVARIAREHDINDNLLFKWKSQYEDGLLSDDDIQECMPVPVALTDKPEPTRPVRNPFWRNKPDERPEGDPGNVPRCELHLKSGVVKLFDPLTPELLRALIREMKGGTR